MRSPLVPQLWPMSSGRSGIAPVALGADQEPGGADRAWMAVHAVDLLI